MQKISDYLKNKLISLNSKDFNWKIIILYLVIVTAYPLLAYFISIFSGDSRNLKPFFSFIIYTTIWPVLSILILLMASWFLSIKVFKISKDIISLPALINILFFSKLWGWLVTLPLIIASWFVAASMYFMPPLWLGWLSKLNLNLLVITRFNLRVIAPLSNWLMDLVSITLLVVAIVFAVQAKNDLERPKNNL